MKPKDIVPDRRYLGREGETRRVIQIADGEVCYWIDGVPSPVPHVASLEEFAKWADKRMEESV